jgi:glycosyltransferase involved in cell wall biosynthesis
MLVDFMNLEKMAAAITTLCKNESLRNKIGKSNRLMVYRNYDLNSHARTIESLYVRICEEKTSNLNTKINFKM